MMKITFLKINKITYSIFFLAMFFSMSGTALGAVIMAPSNTGLIGYWSFNDGNGTKLGDYSGNGNSGTMVNMAEPPTSTSGWGYGKMGFGLNFDTTNDYVNLGVNAISQRTNLPLSVSSWIKWNGVNGQYQRIISRENHFQLSLDTNTNRLLFGMGNGVSGWNSLVNFGSTAVIPVGTWVFVTAVYNGTAVQGYINGVAVGSPITSTMISNNNSLIVSQNSGVGAFNGAIDEIRIYNKALSASEVSSLFSSSFTKRTSGLTSIKMNSPASILQQGSSLASGLTGYWSFNGPDIVNGVIKDRSGNGYDGYPSGISSSTFYAIGKMGQGVNFAGAEYIKLGSAITVPHSSGNSLSISWWEYTTGVSSPTANYPSRFSFKTNNGTQQFIVFRSNDSTNPYDRLSWGETANFEPTHLRCSDCTTLTNSLKSWKHFVIVGTNGAGSRTAGDWTVYENGVSKTVGLSSSYAAHSNQDSRIGLDGLAHSNVQAKLDEVRLYSRALSATEVKQLYNQGR